MSGRVTANSKGLGDSWSGDLHLRAFGILRLKVGPILPFITGFAYDRLCDLRGYLTSLLHLCLLIFKMGCNNRVDLRGR